MPPISAWLGLTRLVCAGGWRLWSQIPSSILALSYWPTCLKQLNLGLVFPASPLFISSTWKHVSHEEQCEVSACASRIPSSLDYAPCNKVSHCFKCLRYLPLSLLMITAQWMLIENDGSWQQVGGRQTPRDMSLKGKLSFSFCLSVFPGYHEVSTSVPLYCLLHGALLHHVPETIEQLTVHRYL